MGMSSMILDNEEMFFDGANDVIIECDTFEEFLEMMKPQMDLVVHLDDVEERLSAMYHDAWSDMKEECGL
tara:strand:+ start:341 stop:550 length:210 start_codon:yes stop_codon:yes gene_type:complete